MKVTLNIELVKLLWEDRPFSKIQAWIDLIENSSTAATSVLFQGTIYTITPNQQVTSDKTLCYKWGWSRNKVRDFIFTLEKLSYITTNRNKKRTIITINLSDTYIIHRTSVSSRKIISEQHQEAQAKEHQYDLTERGLTNTNKQDKEPELGYVTISNTSLEPSTLDKNKTNINPELPFNYD